MQWESCNPTPECKYYPKCFEDRHHPFRQAEATTRLRKEFTALHVLRGCRRYHEQKEAEGAAWVAWPSEEVMRQAVDTNTPVNIDSEVA